jgi:ABC-type branched-subunit amino acid transport system substrate-binding protein
MKKTVWAFLVCAALLAGACGTRADEDEAEQAQQNQLGDDGTDPPAGTDGTTPGSEPAALNDPLFPTNADGQVMFGDIPSPCGEGDASSASDQGVGDTIKIGTIADPGGLVPGLNQEMHDGMQAFTDWCNAQGGINGRQLELTLYDAKLGEYRDRILEACDDMFALVGGGGTFDYLGAQDAVDCGLLEVAGFTVSEEKWEIGDGSGLMYSPLPNPIDGFKVGAARWIEAEYPDVVDLAANTVGDAPVVDVQAARLQKAYEDVGYQFVYNAATPLGGTVADYSQFVVAMRDAGVKYFTFTSTWEELVNFQSAMRQQDFKPEVTDLEANFYNQDYATNGGEGAEGSFVRIAIAPFEEADQYPAVQQYLNIMDEYVPDGKIATLGVHAFSAGLLFATAAKAAGDDLTREATIEQLQQIHEWTGGGLHGSNDVANKQPGPCFIVMEVHDGAFVRRYPLPDDTAYEQEGVNRGFACPDDGFVELGG